MFKKINPVFYLILAMVILRYFKLSIIIALIYMIYWRYKKYGIDKELSKGMRIFVSGIEGEHDVNDILKQVRLENVLLYDTNLSYDNCESQIDHILITKKGVFNIETKNYAGIISIDGNDIWKQISNTGQKNIKSFARQVLQHRHTLEKILNNKYKINDLIVIANKDTQIIGPEYSKVPIVKIDRLNEYIENFQGYYDDYNLNEISEIIKQYRISFLKKVLKKLRYIIINNRQVAYFIISSIIIFFWIISSIPNSLIEDNKSKDVSNNVISVSNINKSMNLNDLNTKVDIIKLSRYENKIVINLDITNNDTKEPIDLYFFKFFVSDNNNQCYELDCYVDDNFTMYGEIIPSEKKQLTLQLHNVNDINVNKLIIKYDDILSNKFEKEIKIAGM
ncbi:nuclease-related domain-containing protein [Clostridium sp. BSD9I1]|uniref:nuclease-related domain-containing protein n=1 Tax=Clostridium sp. BSD9I1 TaxID=2003589 RepID=UPI001648CCE6|nr:nuclease-related domain-containing protein [Clostridium sp. BSD9I1]